MYICIYKCSLWWYDICIMNIETLQAQQQGLQRRVLQFMVWIMKAMENQMGFRVLSWISIMSSTIVPTISPPFVVSFLSLSLSLHRPKYTCMSLISICCLPLSLFFIGLVHIFQTHDVAHLSIGKMFDSLIQSFNFLF